MTQSSTLEQRLNTARLSRFVGRQHEIDRFDSALTAPDVAILYLHGPGGVGKSSLLDVFADRARSRGCRVVRIDARDIDATPATLDRALALSAPAADTAPGPLVLLLDTWELAAPIDPWLRESFLPTLPDDALVVISSRLPPGPEWTAHRAWGPLLQVAGVRNLLPQESEAFLRAQGVGPERIETLIELSYGHPLALALLCVLERQQDAATAASSLRDRPHLVHDLLGRCLDALPQGDERRALAICAHARATTEELLREALELDDAGPLFAWLRGLSIMQEGPHGIFPHDLARDVIDADFRWRDLAGYVDMHARIRAPILRRIRSLRGIARQQAATDLLFMHRNGPVMGKMHVWDTLGYGRAVPATDADLPVILEMVERLEGAESAAIARYWWERMPAGFEVFRGAGDEIFGFNAALTFTEPDAEAIAVDPAIAGMWRVIESRAPLRPGEVAVIDRFAMDRDAHHAPSTGVNMMAMCCLLHWVTTPNLAWSFLAHTDPDNWERVFVYLDQLPWPEGGFRVGDIDFTVFGHDWRVLPVDPWLAMMGEREIASEEPPRPASLDIGTAQVLSRPDFEQAVRRALRDLHDPDALRANPLSRSRLVLATDGRESVALRDRLLAAIQQLALSPRDAKLYRAIERTYLKPAASQELAAEALGLPFNTYRYHLSGGVRRIVDQLWRIELGDG